jgi:hypothetical protein
VLLLAAGSQAQPGNRQQGPALLRVLVVQLLQVLEGVCAAADAVHSLLYRQHGVMWMLQTAAARTMTEQQQRFRVWRMCMALLLAAVHVKKDNGVGNHVVYAVAVHCAMQHRVRKGDSQDMNRAMLVLCNEHGASSLVTVCSIWLWLSMF